VTYNPDIHQRKSLRLKGYDYSKPGAYFVTICIKSRECFLGEVVKGRMNLNEKGQMAQMAWGELPEYYQGVVIDAFQVMPNHIHGIIILNHPISPVGVGPCACLSAGQPQGVAPTMSLSDVVHRFKSLTTTRYRQIINNYGGLFVHGQLWQRTNYKYILQNEWKILLTFSPVRIKKDKK